MTVQNIWSCWKFIFSWQCVQYLFGALKQFKNRRTDFSPKFVNTRTARIFSSNVIAKADLNTCFTKLIYLKDLQALGFETTCNALLKVNLTYLQNLRKKIKSFSIIAKRMLIVYFCLQMPYTNSNTHIHACNSKPDFSIVKLTQLPISIINQISFIDAFNDSVFKIKVSD